MGRGGRGLAFFEMVKEERGGRAMSNEGEVRNPFLPMEDKRKGGKVGAKRKEGVIVASSFRKMKGGMRGGGRCAHNSVGRRKTRRELLRQQGKKKTLLLLHTSKSKRKGSGAVPSRGKEFARWSLNGEEMYIEGGKKQRGGSATKRTRGEKGSNLSLLIHVRDRIKKKRVRRSYSAAGGGGRGFKPFEWGLGKKVFFFDGGSLGRGGGGDFFAACLWGGGRGP